MFISFDLLLLEKITLKNTANLSEKVAQLFLTCMQIKGQTKGFRKYFYYILLNLKIILISLKQEHIKYI